MVTVAFAGDLEAASRVNIHRKGFFFVEPAWLGENAYTAYQRALAWEATCVVVYQRRLIQRWPSLRWQSSKRAKWQRIDAMERRSLEYLATSGGYGVRWLGMRASELLVKLDEWLSARPKAG